MENTKKNYWSVENRLAYIDFRLKWYGRVNRTNLTEHFGISIPQASLDIAKYVQMAPDNIQYDRRAKTYIRKSSYSSTYPETSSAKNFLYELEKNATSFPQETITDSVPTLERSVDDLITEKIVLAIREKRLIQVTYQSMTQSGMTERKILPKCLVFNGSRWHVRAFCFKKNDFRDFMIARILSVVDTKQRYDFFPEDENWDTFVDLLIEPAFGLTDSQKKVVEYDYNMQNHILKLRCRKAHLFYILKKYRFLDPRKKPQQQEIQIKNIDEIKSLLSVSEKRLLSDL